MKHYRYKPTPNILYAGVFRLIDHMINRLANICQRNILYGMYTFYSESKSSVYRARAPLNMTSVFAKICPCPFVRDNDEAMPISRQEAVVYQHSETRTPQSALFLRTIQLMTHLCTLRLAALFISHASRLPHLAETGSETTSPSRCPIRARVDRLGGAREPHVIKLDLGAPRKAWKTLTAITTVLDCAVIIPRQ